MRFETYVCGSCGDDVSRPVVRGQRPKWCADCRRRGAHGLFSCSHCGATTIGSGRKFCSVTCSNRAKPPKARKPPKQKVKAIPADRRSDLSRAIDDGDWLGVTQAVLARCIVVGDCWMWSGSTKKRYAVVSHKGRQVQIHRLILEAKHGGAKLGKQAAHHTCATPACVNPKHLQPIASAHNTAEMLARTYMVQRIADLEGALRCVSPGHELLAEISMNAVA